MSPSIKEHSSSTYRLGMWSAALTSLFTAAALALGITTPPRSGTFCTEPCIAYPYTDGVAFVPKDYLWMYAALLAVLAFAVLAACVSDSTSYERRTFGKVGLIFAVMSATVLAIDYFVQLAVVQPALLHGEEEGLTLLSQYNPHGLFIALEDLGYVLMSLCFLFWAAVFRDSTLIDRALRWALAVGAALVLVSLVVLATVYGSDMGYRFEVTAILVNWTLLIVSGGLLARRFRQSS